LGFPGLPAARVIHIADRTERLLSTQANQGHLMTGHLVEPLDFSLSYLSLDD
jgi:hypothetical protein